MKKTFRIGLRISAAALAALFCFQTVPAYALADPDYETAERSDEGSTVSPEATGLQAGILYEDVSLRDEYTKHFRMSGGMYTAVQYNRPVHYIDKSDGTWSDIKSVLSYKSGGTDGVSGEYTNEDAKPGAALSDNTGGALLKLSGDSEFPLTMSLDRNGLSTVSAEVVSPEDDFSFAEEDESAEEKNRKIIEKALQSESLLYKNAYENASVQCRITSAGAEQEIVVGEGCALNTFTYHINAQGLIAECGVSAGVNFTDSEGNVKYSIGAPYMHDSAGRFYGSVEYVLTEEYLGEYTLSVLVPDSLSSDDEIAYPVFIGFITDICGPDDVPASETICVSSAADTVDDGVPNPQAITVKAAPDAIGRKSGAEYVSYMEFADYPKLAEDDVFISSALALCQYINELPDENNSLVISACRTAEKCSSDNMTWELRPGAYGTPMCTKELSDASGAGAALRCDWNISDELRMYYDGDATQKTVLFSADATSSGLAVLLGSDAPLAYSPYITVNYYRNEAVSADDRDVDQKPAGDNADGGKFEEVASTVITVDGTDATDDGADSLIEASTQSSEFSYASYGITRSYRADNSLWKIIPNNSDIGHTDGVRILTTNKPYYFKYKARVTDNGWQAPVLSTDTEAYAGLTGHYITNLAIEVYEGGRRIYDNYVVMYRAKVAGEWLDWVSNGTPAVMQTIKEDFSLSGNLDINAIDAGWYTRGVIQGFDIKVYERVGYTGSDTGSQFQSLSGLTQEYCVGNAWSPLTSSATVQSGMNGVRLTTSASEEYLLKYKVRSMNYGWNPAVYSTDSSEFAGLYNDLMTNLSIEVYRGNTRIYDDYVVMYRARVAGEWLDWVSNGMPDIMQEIQSEFRLSGNLDTAATDAGWYTRGAIQSLDIRLYKRINSSSVTGSGDFQTANGITMKYRAEGNTEWSVLTPSVHKNYMDGILLQTSGKPYYLYYNTRHRIDGENRWRSSFISSSNADSNAFAGYSGRPITNIEIRVYNTANERIFDDYVVMYRVKVPTAAGDGEEWLDWVSNGQPNVMQSIQSQFGLPGKLDTSATDAGWASRGYIKSLEIRVYERAGSTVSTDSCTKYIDAPYINQNDWNLPNGCESVTAVMALQYFGIAISPSTFVNRYLDKGAPPSGNTGLDPNKVYVGDPAKKNGLGWGCYAPVIVNSIKRIVDSNKFDVKSLYGNSLESLCHTYIDSNVPVILWATVGMKTDGYYGRYRDWVTPEGVSVRYYCNLHCLLLVGYNDDYYFFNDPLVKNGAQKSIAYPKSMVSSAYNLLGCQAVVVTNKTAGGIGTATNPGKPNYTDTPEETVKIRNEASEYQKKQTLKEEYRADPIDLSKGAHVISHTLMTLNGAQSVSVTADYSSNSVIRGELGIGWSHNFEKSVRVFGDTVRVYDNAAYYALYTRSQSDSNTYTTATKSKENYVLTKTSQYYIVDCNHKATEYYDVTNGRLVKITYKNGLSTQLTYPTAATVRITDSVSGRYMTITKDSDGRIVSVSDNSGRISTLEYTDGCLTGFTDENGNKISYRYNSKSQIERGVDGNGTVFFVDAYDSLGRIISQKDAVSDSLQTVISYDENSAPGYTLVRVTDRLGELSVYKYNQSGQLICRTDPNNITESYEYDSAGNVIRKTDGLGNSILSAYDAKGNLLSSTDKTGKITSYVYDSHNNMICISYPGAGSETYSYDTNDRLVSHTDARGLTVTYEYNAAGLPVKVSSPSGNTLYEYTAGQVSAVTDRLGRRSVKGYTAAGFLASVTDSLNNTTAYTRDNKGNVLSVTYADGSVSSKQYDVNGNVTRETNAAGYSTEYTYNGNLKMTSMTLPTGATLYYEYDKEDRLIKTSYPDGSSAVNAYDAGGRLISKTDRDGSSESYEYDNAGNTVKITNAAGGVTLKGYDAGGNVISSTQVIEKYTPSYYTAEEETEDDGYTRLTTVYEYGSDGRLVKTTNPAGGETVYSYNAAGDVLSVTDPVGNITANSYDAEGRLVSVADPRGNTTSYTYDAEGELISVENALGQITANAYDSAGRLLSTTDPGGHTTSYTYDELGRMASCTDARGNTEYRYYDALGNVVKITNRSGRTEFEAVYDEGGRAVQVKDSAGSKTVSRYDWEGNLTEQTNALGETSSYTYNGAGQTVGSVDKAGGVCYATYDGMGNLTSMTGPEGAESTYTYNSAGQLNERVATYGGVYMYMYNALGLKSTVYDGEYAQTHYSYDAAGRVTSFVNNDGTTTYTYDANGNVLSATDGTGTVRREYDALNRVSKYTDIYGNEIRYEYNACGDLSKMVYPTGEIGEYTYDGNHNMLTSSVKSAEESEEKVSAVYEYDKENRVKKAVNADGSIVTKSYDSAGRLQVVNDRTKDGQYISVFIYSYDELSRIVGELNPITGENYIMTYDALGRLVKRTKTDFNHDGAVLGEETFVYDAAGNITEDDSGNTYEYGDGNDLWKVNNRRGWTNSNGGNSFYIRPSDTQYKTPMNVKYDAKNRLKTIGGSVNEYWYDAEDNRVNMYHYSTNMKYTYDSAGGRSRLVWSSSHLLEVTTYAYGAEGLIWSRANGKYQVYHYDYRGSVIAVTDIDGNVTDTVAYNAYGKQTERTGTSKLIFGYNGRYGVLSDPNGLLYMRTRYYDPSLKRFMSADVIDGSITDSTSLNVYTFVNGNPISFIDPFGLSADRASNNENVINDLHWLYNCSYDYFNMHTDEAERIRVTNDAVMKYLICERFYYASFLKGIAWENIAGSLDINYFKYMWQHNEFLSVRDSTFYDLSSGEEIDFLHMIATLCACNYESNSGALATIPSAYAGWAGDLITLAGDVNDKIDGEDCDIVKLTKDLMGSNRSTFPISDLIGDIDAVLINEYMTTMPIDKAFEAYYSSDYKDRYSKFLAKEFGGYIDNLYSSAEHYLSPGLLNTAFKKAFDSKYSKDIIPYVAQGFTEYLVYEAGR